MKAFLIVILLFGCMATEAQEQSVGKPSPFRVVPIGEIVQIAEAIRTHIKTNIRDYTGLMVKREFVDGKDTGYQYIRFKLRESPLSIYFHYVKPHAGREVLYGGKDELIVKRGGSRGAPNLTLAISLDSVLATDGNRYTIKEMGLLVLSERLIKQLKAEMGVPDTEVRVYDNAKINGKLVTHYRMLHHTQTPQATCRMAEIAVDKALNIPIYYRSVGWQEPTVILEEYAFREMSINVGLIDEDFKETNPAYGFQKQPQPQPLTQPIVVP
jgi:hypothetical protein